MDILNGNETHQNLVRCACCKLCHKLIDDIEECPSNGENYCDPDCVEYDEIWDENELKEELKNEG